MIAGTMTVASMARTTPAPKRGAGELLGVGSIMAAGSPVSCPDVHPGRAGARERLRPRLKHPRQHLPVGRAGGPRLPAREHAVPYCLALGPQLGLRGIGDARR